MITDCLPATGLDAGPLALVVILCAAALLVGAVLVVRSRRARASVVVALLLVIGSGAGLSVATPTSASAACVSIAGTWEGEYPGSEVPGEVPPYDVVATITDDGVTVSATILYPPLCTAVWTQVSRTATTVVFHEVVDDPIACTDLGTVTITPAGSPATSLGYLYRVAGAPDQAITLLRAP